MGLHESGFGLGDPRLGADIGRFERHWIDLIERISFMDVTAFGEKSLLHDPGHLRPDLDNAGGFGLADKLRLIRHGLVVTSMNVTSGGDGGSRSGLLLATEQSGIRSRTGAYHESVAALLVIEDLQCWIHRRRETGCAWLR